MDRSQSGSNADCFPHQILEISAPQNRIQLHRNRSRGGHRFQVRWSVNSSGSDHRQSALDSLSQRVQGAGQDGRTVQPPVDQPTSGRGQRAARRGQAEPHHPALHQGKCQYSGLL
jgi:hypothetical protein